MSDKPDLKECSECGRWFEPDANSGDANVCPRCRLVKPLAEAGRPAAWNGQVVPLDDLLRNETFRKRLIDELEEWGVDAMDEKEAKE